MTNNVLTVLLAVLLVLVLVGLISGFTDDDGDGFFAAPKTERSSVMVV